MTCPVGAPRLCLLTWCPELPSKSYCVDVLYLRPVARRRTVGGVELNRRCPIRGRNGGCVKRGGTVRHSHAHLKHHNYWDEKCLFNPLLYPIYQQWMLRLLVFGKPSSSICVQPCQMALAEPLWTSPPAVPRMGSPRLLLPTASLRPVFAVLPRERLPFCLPVSSCLNLSTIHRSHAHAGTCNANVALCVCRYWVVTCLLTECVRPRPCAREACVR